jgi:hypothetical protein
MHEAVRGSNARDHAPRRELSPIARSRFEVPEPMRSRRESEPCRDGSSGASLVEPKDCSADALPRADAIERFDSHRRWHAFKATHRSRVRSIAIAVASRVSGVVDGEVAAAVARDRDHVIDVERRAEVDECETAISRTTARASPSDPARATWRPRFVATIAPRQCASRAR